MKYIASNLVEARAFGFTCEVTAGDDLLCFVHGDTERAARLRAKMVAGAMNLASAHGNIYVLFQEGESDTCA